MVRPYILILLCLCTGVGIQAQDEFIRFYNALVSGDGRYVFFESNSTDIHKKLFRYDIEEGQYESLNIIPDSLLAEAVPFDTDYRCINLNDVSYDGNVISLLSCDPTLTLAWGGNPSVDYGSLIYRYQVDSEELTLVTINDERIPNYRYVYETTGSASRISGNGRYVAFIALEQESEFPPQAYLYDSETGISEVLGTVDTDRIVWNVDIDEGNTIAYVEEYYPLEGANNRVFRYQIDTGESEMIAQDENGNPLSLELGLYDSISSNGCCVIMNPSYGSAESAYIYDEALGLTRIVESFSFDFDVSSTAIQLLDISEDGRYVLMNADVAGNEKAYLLDRETQDILFLADNRLATMSDNAKTIVLLSYQQSPILINLETNEEIDLGFP